MLGLQNRFLGVMVDAWVRVREAVREAVEVDVKDVKAVVNKHVNQCVGMLVAVVAEQHARHRAVTIVVARVEFLVVRRVMDVVHHACTHVK